jgi:hypothetical protein
VSEEIPTNNNAKGASILFLPILSWLRFIAFKRITMVSKEIECHSLLEEQFQGFNGDKLLATL